VTAAIRHHLLGTLAQNVVEDPKELGSVARADDTCIYVTDHEEGHVLIKLQRELAATET
jgi:hypothetical protein